MKKSILTVILSLALFAIYAFTTNSAKEVEVISLEQLQSKTIQKNNTLYIVNFWATWCKPCIVEMPYFEEAGKKFANKKVKVLLVSLDFKSDIERVTKFVENKKLESEVYMLSAGNPNVWIDKIDSTWSGALPATVMYQNGQKIFFRDGDFNNQELDSLIQTKIY